MLRARSYPTLAPDTRVADRFRVERILGTGGMGVVYLATDEIDRSRVALKVPHESLAQSFEVAERLRREGRAMAQLESPHIARFIEFLALEDGRPALVFEYLDGRDLAEVLRVDGIPPLDVALDWIEQACDGVGEAHSLGIVHRDLKPSNLFLAREEHGRQVIKVLDFGIATLDGTGTEVDALTTEGSVVGTRGYMAPEQLAGHRIADVRTDVFSLAVCAFELLTKQRPFAGDNVVEYGIVVNTTPPRSLREIRPEVPTAISDVITAALAREPASRFRDAVALRDALRDARGGRVAPLLFGTPTLKASPPRAQDTSLLRELDHERPASEPTARMMRQALSAPATMPAVSISTTPLQESRGRRGKYLLAPLSIGLLVMGVVGVLTVTRASRSSPETAGHIAPPVDIVGGEVVSPPADGSLAPVLVSPSPHAALSASSARPSRRPHPGKRVPTTAASASSPAPVWPPLER